MTLILGALTIIGIQLLLSGHVDSGAICIGWVVMGFYAAIKERN